MLSFPYHPLNLYATGHDQARLGLHTQEDYKIYPFIKDQSSCNGKIYVIYNIFKAIYNSSTVCMKMETNKPYKTKFYTIQH